MTKTSKHKWTLDADYIKYAVAGIAEQRTVNVVHRQSGREKIFKTRSEFYGHWAKKQGGWLAELNKTRETPFLAEEFDYYDIQTPLPIENALHSCKMMIKSLENVLGNKWYGYLGRGDSWRVEASTILKYKGQRADNLRPLQIDAVEDYLLKYHPISIVTGLEVDDQVVIDCIANPSLILVGVDKDYKGCAVNLYNPNESDKGVQDCRGFGELYLNAKGEVKGFGRKWFYFQVAFADASDNYYANSACGVKWGEKSAYKALVDCKTDTECHEALFEIYQHLYPEPKLIKGWRGDDVAINWRYVLQENLTMAHMLRREKDFMNIQRMQEEYGD